jgi:sulfotransferase family protein
MAYQRRPPPLPMQVAFGLVMERVFGPFLRRMERRGTAGRLFARQYEAQEKRIRKKNPFRNYEPGPQDVFVMTYAKSGTNWMMQIAHQLIYHGKGDYDHLHEVVPWPDTAIMPLFMKRYAIPFEDATHWKQSPEQKRVIKTHYNWDLLPHSKDARYIAVIRDPKDVFASNYVFVRDGVYGSAMPSVDTWFDLYLSPHFPLGGSWAVNAAGYWAERHRPNVMVESFKSMKRDLRGTVRRVADFLGIRASDALVDDVCRLSSFDYMKKNDHKYAIGQVVPWRKPGAMIRKGLEGGSSELLSPERQRLIDQHFMAELQQLGSDFPYTEFCTLAP